MQRPPLGALFLNHLDAWVVAVAVVVSALVVHGRVAWDTLPLVAVIGLAYWLAFALNDYFDAPADALDPQKARGNYFSEQRGQRAWFWLAALGLMGLISAVLARYGWAGGAVVVVGALVAWAYSAPPLRLKARPGLDVLTHAAFVESFPYAAALLLIGVAWSALDAFILAVLFLASLSAQLEQQLRDFELDKLSGRTFATCAGRPLTHALLVLTTITLIAGAGIYYLRWEVPWYLVPYGVIPLPALLHRLMRGPHRPRSPQLVTLTALIGLAYTLWLVASRFVPAAS